MVVDGPENNGEKLPQKEIQNKKRKNEWENFRPNRDSTTADVGNIARSVTKNRERKIRMIEKGTTREREKEVVNKTTGENFETLRIAHQTTTT